MEKMWAVLLHFGELWGEKSYEHIGIDRFRLDRDIWNKAIDKCEEVGVDTIIIDLCEGIVYKSHPELAVEGSFDHARMKQEIDKIQSMGFEIVPKLNFSAAHDIWLKDYSYMLSTPIYYKVVKDLINEVCDVFKPRFLHIGMEEETLAGQKNHRLVVIRQGELWWHDMHYIIDCIESNGARPWVWGGSYMWRDAETFLKNMPKSVMVSNWYYSDKFDEESDDLKFIKNFTFLNEDGYDQVPTGSTFGAEKNFENLTKYCCEILDPEHFKGMMLTTWERVDPDWMHKHRKAEEVYSAAKSWYDKNK